MAMNARDKAAYRTDEKEDGGLLTPKQRRQIFYVCGRESVKRHRVIDAQELMDARTP
jgi:hypothetical protein